MAVISQVGVVVTRGSTVIMAVEPSTSTQVATEVLMNPSASSPCVR